MTDRESGLRDVSRETLVKLKLFSALVEKWTDKINLVSNGSRSHIWQRHVVDSAQVYNLAPSGRWLDIGSGGGFPGIVAAILARGNSDDRPIMLIESDKRKCAFLRTASRELNLNAEVVSDRIEQVPGCDAMVVSARALADLSTLLGFAERHMNSDGVALLMKGKTWQEEHAEAQKQWSYDLEVTTSTTNPDAVVLKVKEIRRV